MAEPQVISSTTASNNNNSCDYNYDWNYQQQQQQQQHHNYYNEYEAAVSPQPQDDDPYVYSDDSASLSDAYFRPSDSPTPSTHLPLMQIQAPAFTPYHPNNFYNIDKPQAVVFGTASQGYFWRTATTTTTPASSIHSSENDPLVGNGEMAVASSYGSDRSVASSATTESSLAYGFSGFRKHEIHGSILEDVPVIEEKEDLSALYRYHHYQQLPKPNYYNHNHNTRSTSSTSPSLLLAASGGFRKYQERQQQVVSSSSSTLPPRSQQQHQQRRLQIMERKHREQLAREVAVSKIRGQSQESTSSFTDVWWAILFLVQLAIIIYSAIHFGSNHTTATLSNNNSISSTAILSRPLFPTRSSSDDRFLITSAAAADVERKSNFLDMVVYTGCFACILSYLSFGFMLIVARAVIQIILFLSIVLALVWSILGWTVQQHHGDTTIIAFTISLLGCCALALTVGYTLMVWNRIDLAATNLYVALCAMRCTADVALLGLISVLVSFGWCMVWSMAAIGIQQASVICNKGENCDFPLNDRWVVLRFLFLVFSFCWTTMVIKNVVRVVVASAVGTWWFQPKSIRPCCTNAVAKPLVRSLMKSLGSICLGSLVVLPAQALLLLINCWARLLGDLESTDNKSTADADLDAAPSLATKMPASSHAKSYSPRKQSFFEYCYHCLRCCNRWSYSYIGMYGYSFAKGGDKAIQLFETREWLEVVNENLPRNVLLMASLVIGGSTGCFAVLVEEVNGVDFSAFRQPMAVAFGIGSVLGFCLSNVLLLGLVGSAVNTVLVCFAAGPFEFDKNHPRLSREMREVWSQQVWEPPV